MDKNGIIENTIEQLIYLEGIDGDKIPHFCFFEDIVDSLDVEISEQDIRDTIDELGGKIYKVFAGETAPGGLVVCAPECDITVVERVYQDFFGEAPEIEPESVETEDIQESKLTEGPDEFGLLTDDELDELNALTEAKDKPTKNELKDRAKKHKKTDKKGAKGWFVNPNAGNVEHNIAHFNRVVGNSSGKSPSALDGGFAPAPAGLGEDFQVDEAFEKHDELNPKIWDGEELKPEIKEKVQAVVDDFIEGLSKNEIEMQISDIILIGSNCSYNYTDDSDLDIHVIYDKDSLESPESMLPLLYSAYRSIYNKKYSIDFYGIEVEIFVEDGEDTLGSDRLNGIYSINSGWIKKPDKDLIPDPETIDVERFNREFEEWENKYFDLVSGEEIEDKEPIDDILEEDLENSLKHDQIENFLEDIYEFRKLSLQHEGEYGIGNLVFKEMRTMGYLDVLKNLKDALKSKELSLEGMMREESGDTFPLSWEKLKELNIKEDGTYVYVDGVLTKKVYDNGYQASYFRPEITNEEIQDIHNTIGGALGVLHIGIYGDPEISYWFNNLEEAMEFAKIFNQFSVWGWEESDEIENDSHDKTIKVNYSEAKDKLIKFINKETDNDK